VNVIEMYIVWLREKAEQTKLNMQGDEVERVLNAMKEWFFGFKAKITEVLQNNKDADVHACLKSLKSKLAILNLKIF
jgi:translation initiation factor 1 (eIF-1/SUI1)